jgi:hypothetical protein
MWTEVSSSVPHFLQIGLSLNPIIYTCLLRVLCLVSRPVTTLDWVLLKDTLSPWAEMSFSSDKCVSESDSNTNSVMPRSVMFSPYSHTAKCMTTQFSTQHTQHLLTQWFKPQQCTACRMLFLWEKRHYWSVQLKKNISMNLQFKKSQRNPYSRMEDVCLWSHIALTREINICILTFSLPQIAFELYSTQISQQYHKTQILLQDWNLNNIWVLLPASQFKHSAALGDKSLAAIDQPMRFKILTFNLANGEF